MSPHTDPDSCPHTYMASTSTTELFPPPLPFVCNLRFFVSGMLTITDFINILHRYYKSPMVSGMDLTVCGCGQDGMGFPSAYDT